MAPLLLNTAGSQRLAILIYHRVVPEPDPLRPGEPDVAQFDWQMRLLREHFNPLPLREAVQRLREGSLPPRAVCVTFDDGYADNESLALPVLQKYALPATVFVSTGFLGGGRMFNDCVIETIRHHPGGMLDLVDLGLAAFPLHSVQDRVAAIEGILASIKEVEPSARLELVTEIENRVGGAPADLMMSNDQVRHLADSGVEIGAHTVNHPILTSVPDFEARSEISASKTYLEDVLQRPVRAFAYPNGRPGKDYASAHSAMVSEVGFELAVSTHWGVCTSASDVFQLPRFTPWDRTPVRFAARLLLNYRRADPLAA
ncbi:MAG: polysaccharide deacetylase family protein [Halioglobus sp.]|nr:polysaccharide deacetylase family protein [Halioglobus sp.]